MRFYSIVITGTTSATYTSFVQGAVDPGALDIELDITASSFASPIGYATVRIWGVSLQTIGQASDFNGASIKVYGGMSKGLPLATAAFNAGQQGLLCQGTVFQGLGNWINHDQYLELVIATDGGATQSEPANLSYNWASGSSLSDNIEATIGAAYPAPYGVNVNIGSNLVLTELEAGVHQTIQQFTSSVNLLSKAINTDPAYPGVDIVLQGSIFYVYDGSNLGTTKQLLFQDLIGQPTYIGPGQVQFNAVLRADISPGDLVMFPQGIQTTQTQAQLGNQPDDKSSFSGAFTVAMVRHVGHFRGRSGTDWISTFNAYAPPTAATAPALPDATG